MGTTAGDEPRRSRKVFPARLKTFVRNFGRDGRYGRRKSDAAVLEYGQRTSILEPTTSLDPTLNLEPKDHNGDMETPGGTVLDLADRNSSRASGDYSLREVNHSRGQDDSWSIADVTTQELLGKPGLSVRVGLTFEEPLSFSYSRSFDSSSTLEVSEKLCRGLIRRIDHSCFEVVTRKDPNALAPVRDKGRPKPIRFELTTEISQEGAIWAVRTYKSYQKEPLTAEAAKEIVLTSHRMVGLFLKRHDPDFVWKDGPVRDDSCQGPETSPYRTGHVQALNCIPRTHFDEQSQTFEATPGFSVEVSLLGRGRQIDGPKWTKEIRITSNQTSPLTLTLAEGLFSDASYALEGALRSRRQVVQARHYQRCGPISGACQHHREDAVEVNLKVVNDLGPQYEHLERTLKSKMVLFDGAERLERTEFVAKLRQSLAEARDVADNAIAKTNDFEFTVVELRGTDWSMDDPIVFTLPATVSYSRRSIEAVLERVQTGIAAILRGNANSVRFLAWKRGHFILDKTLVARVPKIETRRWSTPSKTKAKVIERLKRRIEQDIEMICKDTCSLDNLDEDMPSLPQKLAGTAATSVAEADSILQDTNPANIPLPRTPTENDRILARSVPLPQTPPANDSSIARSVPLPQTPPANETYGEQTPFTPLTREWSGEFRDPNSRGRAFPLVPSASTFGIKEVLQRRQAENEDPFEAMSPTDEEVEYDSKGLIEGTTESKNEQDAARARNTSDAKEPSSTEPPNESTVTTGQHDARRTPDHAAILRRLPSFSTAGTPRLLADTASQVSTAPSTPSLVFCNGQSPRGSFALLTPKIRSSSSMSNAEVEQVMARRGSEGYTDDEDVLHANADPEAYPRFWKIAPDEAMIKRWSKSRYAPSPLHQEDIIMPETDDLGISHPSGSVTPQQDAQKMASPPQDPLDKKAQRFVQNILEMDGTVISPIDSPAHDILDQQAQNLAQSLLQDDGAAVSPRSSPKLLPLVQDAQHLVHDILQDNGTAPGNSQSSYFEPELESEQDPLIREARHLVQRLSRDCSAVSDYEDRPLVDYEDAEATPTVNRFSHRLGGGHGGSGSGCSGPTSAPRELKVPIVTSTDEEGVEEDIQEAVPHTPTSRDFSPDSEFAQTRQDIDFDYSSAFTASPFSQNSQATQYGRINDGIDELALDDFDFGGGGSDNAHHNDPEPSPPSPPVSRSRIGSSGSAGLLGFSDPLSGLRGPLAPLGSPLASPLGSPPGARRLFSASPLGLHTGAGDSLWTRPSGGAANKDDLSAPPPLLSREGDDSAAIDTARPTTAGREKATTRFRDASALRRSMSSHAIPLALSIDGDDDDFLRGRRGRSASRDVEIS